MEFHDQEDVMLYFLGFDKQNFSEMFSFDIGFDYFRFSTTTVMN